MLNFLNTTQLLRFSECGQPGSPAQRSSLQDSNASQSESALVSASPSTSSTLSSRSCSSFVFLAEEGEVNSEVAMVALSQDLLAKIASLCRSVFAGAAIKSAQQTVNDCVLTPVGFVLLLLLLLLLLFCKCVSVCKFIMCVCVCVCVCHCKCVCVSSFVDYVCISITVPSLMCSHCCVHLLLRSLIGNGCFHTKVGGLQVFSGGHQRSLRCAADDSRSRSTGACATYFLSHLHRV
jgi:hypothetical protein